MDRTDLVGEYIGQTAPKVKDAIEMARGGVLFIDEAYSLARSAEDSKDFGREVIEILVREMSNGAGVLGLLAVVTGIAFITTQGDLTAFRKPCLRGAAEMAGAKRWRKFIGRVVNLLARRTISQPFEWAAIVSENCSTGYSSMSAARAFARLVARMLRVRR